MKAVRFHEYGDPDVLRYEDVEQPIPGAGEVRIRVAATSFNAVDAGIRGGYLQGPFPVTLPHTPGIDVSGTVDALGEGVEDVTVGDAVVAFLPMTAPGAAAEFVIAPAEVMAAAPAKIPLPAAAALPTVGLTAWQALFDDVGLQEGQRVLINGAGGAVGGYAVQVAKRAGAHVIATATARSAERARLAGADEVIDYTNSSVADAVAEPLDVLLNLAQIAPEELVAQPPSSKTAASSSTRCRRSRRPPTRSAACALSASSSAATPSSCRGWWRWSTGASCASTSPSASRWRTWRTSTPGQRPATILARSSWWSTTTANNQAPSTPPP